MSSRPLARRAPAALALLVALACGGEERTAAPATVPAPEAAATAPEPGAAEAPASAPAAPPAAAPAGPTVHRTLLPDGRVFEAEYGQADQLPTDFPDDVPLYGNARPLSSMAAPEHGAIVNLRSADPPERVFAWYRDRFVEQGWEVELAKQERARSTVVARKGNRVSSVVITAVPGATQAILSVLEER